jgi:hypothetical protein
VRRVKGAGRVLRLFGAGTAALVLSDEGRAFETGKDEGGEDPLFHRHQRSLTGSHCRSHAILDAGTRRVVLAHRSLVGAV